MFENEYTQMARDRRDAHEAYIEEQTILRSLVTRRSLSLSTLVLFLLALFSFFFASGCATPVIAAGGEQMVEDEGIGKAAITGRYRIYDTGYPSILDLAPDGTFRRAASEKALVDAPVDMGHWSIEDEILILTSSESIESCGNGRTGRYQISDYEAGGYLFERLSEECEGRVGFVPTPEVHPLQPAGLLCELASGELCANK